MNWRGLEHDRLHDLASNSEVHSSSMILESMKQYCKAIDTILERENGSTKKTRNEYAAKPTSPSEQASVVAKKSEENTQPDGGLLKSGIFVDKNIDSNRDT